MHRDLALFLREVWTEVTETTKGGNVFQQIAKANEELAKRHRRRTIDSPEHPGMGSASTIHKAVYGVYNRFESTQAGLAQNEVPAWLDELNRIGQGVTRRRLQIGARFVDFDPVFASFLAGRADEEEAAALRGGFIHFVNQANAGAVANVRVYVNVTPRAGLTMLRFLLEKLTEPEPEPEFVVGGPPSESPIMKAMAREEGAPARSAKAARQFASIKIAGPLSLGKRSDGILVYCPTKASARGVVRTLAAAPRQWFAPEVPRMTEAAGPPGVGIAIGAEPPQVNTGIRGTNQQSFGSLRAELITGALLEAEFSERLTKSPGHFAFFCSRVEEAFRGNGLDPNAPAYNLPAE